jgi:hypothetical protein
MPSLEFLLLTFNLAQTKSVAFGFVTINLANPIIVVKPLKTRGRFLWKTALKSRHCVKETVVWDVLVLVFFIRQLCLGTCFSKWRWFNFFRYSQRYTNIFRIFVCVCTSVTPQRPGHGTVPWRVATLARNLQSRPKVCGGAGFESVSAALQSGALPLRYL